MPDPISPLESITKPPPTYDLAKLSIGWAQKGLEACSKNVLNYTVKGSKPLKVDSEFYHMASDMLKKNPNNVSILKKLKPNIVMDKSQKKIDLTRENMSMNEHLMKMKIFGQYANEYLKNIRQAITGSTR